MVFFVVQCPFLLCIVGWILNTICSCQGVNNKMDATKKMNPLFISINQYQTVLKVAVNPQFSTVSKNPGKTVVKDSPV
jgi:hypothetical protein